MSCAVGWLLEDPDKFITLVEALPRTCLTDARRAFAREVDRLEPGCKKDDSVVEAEEGLRARPNLRLPETGLKLAVDSSIGGWRKRPACGSCELSGEEETSLVRAERSVTESSSNSSLLEDWSDSRRARLAHAPEAGAVAGAGVPLSWIDSYFWLPPRTITVDCVIRMNEQWSGWDGDGGRVY